MAPDSGAQSNRGILERDAKAIGNVGRLRFSPIAVAGGQGCYLRDEDGRQILDLSASCGPAVIGYSHPAVVEAVTRAVSDMAGASQLLYPNGEAVKLAERLIASVPGTAERRAWFGHSGSDANDAAVRILANATGRARFISFIGSYHGGVSGSMAVSGHTAMTHSLPRPGLTLIPYPDTYRGQFPADEILKLLDFQLETTCPGEQVAALFMEPILSDGGLLVPPPGFFQAIQERCRRYGIMLAIDEVKVGMGRSGLLHAFQHDGLEPDLVMFGKGLGGGLPLSAVVGPAALMDHAPAFAMQTTGGNPVATAAGNTVLDVIESEGLVQRAAEAGAAMTASLRALADKHECIGEVRGRGLAIGIDLVSDRETRAPAPGTLSAKIIYRAYQLGAAFVYVGLSANVLELTPPLTISDAEIDEGIDIIDRAIADAVAGKVSDAEVAPYMMW